MPLTELVDEWLDLMVEDAEALDCRAEVARAREIAAGGTSADRQRAVLSEAEEGGADRAEALRAVVTHLAEEFRAGL